MALITKIKVSSITNLSDARYCSGMGVRYLGFNFLTGHPSFVPPDKFREIISWISGPELIGEFEDARPTEIRNTLSGLAVDGIEISRIENLNELAMIVPGKKIFLRLDLADYPSSSELERDLDFAAESADFFILEKSGNKGLSIETIFSLGSRHPLLLGFGFDSGNIRKIIAETGIEGIELQGGTEDKVGFKDYDILADIFEALDSDSDSDRPQAQSDQPDF